MDPNLPKFDFEAERAKQLSELAVRRVRPVPIRCSKLPFDCAGIRERHCVRLYTLYSKKCTQSLAHHRCVPGACAFMMWTTSHGVGKEWVTKTGALSTCEGTKTKARPSKCVF